MDSRGGGGGRKGKRNLWEKRGRKGEKEGREKGKGREHGRRG